MIARRLRRPLWAALLVLGGCDPNPGGPSAPSPSSPESPTPSEPSPKDAPRSTPLRKAGQPIGTLMPLPPLPSRP